MTKKKGIEKGFFEAFGISKIDGYKCIPHNTIENKCELVISGFTDCCSNCEHLEKNYPPITPEIVLGLEEIIITFCATHLPNGEIYQDEMCLIIAKTNANEYYYNILVEFNGDDYEDGYHEPYGFKNARAKNRVDSLLSLCTQLKDEIQDQVKALFNA